MDAALTERLPSGIRSELEELRRIEAQLLSQISGTQGELLDALATERDQHLRRVCEALETLDDAELRRSTLLTLAGANQRIADAATAALSETMVLSRQGAHQRKAISAYGTMDEEGG